MFRHSLRLRLRIGIDHMHSLKLRLRLNHRNNHWLRLRLGLRLSHRDRVNHALRPWFNHRHGLWLRLSHRPRTRPNHSLSLRPNQMYSHKLKLKPRLRSINNSLIIGLYPCFITYFSKIFITNFRIFKKSVFVDWSTLLLCSNTINIIHFFHSFWSV